MRIPTHDEILDAHHQGDVAIIQLFDRTLEDFQEELQELQTKLQTLEGQLNKNSKNSSKPPSSDGLKKPRTKSLRKKGRKKNGGQEGHKGHSLKPVENPDHTEVHKVSRCIHCGASLEDVEVDDYQTSQVFDMPPVKVEVTEHKAEIKTCPNCNMCNVALLPPGATSPVQYGYRIKALMAYLNNYQLTPLERTCDFFEDLFGHRPSEAIVLQANETCAENVKLANEAIKEQLINSDVVNFDETGFRVENRGQWLHVACNLLLTCYHVHLKRGRETMDSADILPQFKGTSVHDHWKPYFTYENVTHSLCNAHILRELTYIYEQYGQEWAEKMINFLLNVKNEVDQARLCRDQFHFAQIAAFEDQYEEIVMEGLKLNPPPPRVPGKRGRVKQSDPKNLLDRLKKYIGCVLAFMYDFRVPFENNQAERDVRMMKVKQKVSGTFRTMEGAERFCAIRGYISTARKNGYRVLDAIQNAFMGNPFIPAVCPVKESYS